MPTREEDREKQPRLRKVYIQLRIPRVKAEIAALATRKKSLMNGSGQEASKGNIEELIYSNQHMAALRKELETLEEERKTVLQGLREMRLEKEKATAGTPHG
jgi:flagellar motility protein MotE (MotC chaperone)